MRFGAPNPQCEGLDALKHAAPEGGIVEVRRFGGAQQRAPTLLLVSRSDSDLVHQVAAPGATWLDHRLVSNEDASFAHAGFGAEALPSMPVSSV
jgi:hypothetical protein